MSTEHPSHIDTLVIGGGQAGLATGYHLQRAGVPFLIVDANARTGDAWRNRWDSLKLFTPNRFNSLPGRPIPGDDWGFPTKDQLANYLEEYAGHFGFPISRETRISELTRDGERFVARTGASTITADNVVVAMAAYQEPKTPDFADELDSNILQIHIDGYRNPNQLKDGDVLVVGLGNSGAEIAKELVQDRDVFLSGEPSAVQPFHPEKMSGRILMPIVGPYVMDGLLSTSTPMGRRFKEKMYDKAAPLLRVKPKELEAAGVNRVGRTAGVVDGSPVLEDGTVLDVANVVWCTGFGPGFSWIKLPVFDDHGEVMHERGVSEDVPGLYFVSLKFQHSALSDTLLCVGKEARLIVDKLVSRQKVSQATAETV